MWYIVKIAVTTGLIVLISEIAKRSSLLGAILASVPIVSVLAMIWLYIDTRNIAKVSELSRSVFWLVLPSLALFVTLPILLDRGLNFYLAMLIAIVATIISYFLMLWVLPMFGVRV